MCVKHYLDVYRGFIEVRLSEQMSFRVNFVLLLLLDIIFYATSLFTVSFLYDHIELIGPWSRSQLLFFVSFMLCIDQLHMALLSESFWVFAMDLKSGLVDFHLLRPTGSVFNLFFPYFRPSGIPTFFIVWGLTIYYGCQSHLLWWDWFFLPFFVLWGLGLLFVIELIFCVGMFWMTEGVGINFLRMQIQNASRWPDFIYQTTPRRLLTFIIPILVIGSAPVRFLFNKQDFWPLIWMIIATITGILVFRILWRMGLRRYESASS